MQAQPVPAAPASAHAQAAAPPPQAAGEPGENAVAILCLLLALTVFWLALQLMKLGGKSL